ncbi:MAG: serine/threonine-protein kinase, partial [Myxococcota bacterium]
VALKLARCGHRGDLMREAEVLAAISHPAVLRYHDSGVVANTWYLATELVSGTRLDLWQSQPQSWPALVTAYMRAGIGLSAVPRAGYVHRDFKPSNVIVVEDHAVRLIDLGLAKPPTSRVRSRPTARALRRVLAEHYSRLTSGRRPRSAGTPSYMAPEQWLGLPTDERADQYSFCAATYEALHCRDGCRRWVANREQTSPTAFGSLDPAAVPDELTEILRRGMATYPDDRWPDMDALLIAMAQAMTRRARPRGYPV